HPLAFQGTGEGLAEKTKPFHQLGWPGSFAPNRAEGEHAEHGATGAQGDGHLRARTHTLVVCAIERRVLWKLIDPGESDDVSAPQPHGRPGKLISVHDPRRLLEAGQ